MIYRYVLPTAAFATLFASGASATSSEVLLASPINLEETVTVENTEADQVQTDDEVVSTEDEAMD